MKIVHVTFNLNTGGTETMLVDIINRQLADGDTPVLLLINSGHRQELIDSVDPRVEKVFLDRPLGSRNPLWLIRYYRALRRLRPDIVHIHNARALGMLYGPHKFKTVYTYHCCGDVNKWHGRADRLCAISQAVARDVESRGEGKPTIVYNGIDTSAIPRRPGTPAHTPVRMIQIGSLKHAIKGQHISLKALALMKNTDVTLDFCGDGPSKDFLSDLAGGLGIGHRVRFMGIMGRKDLYDSLPQYDIALLPSLNEGFGLALAEPMAAGVPVVVSDLPGPGEIIHGHGRPYATAADAGDAAALAAAIDDVINNYPRHIDIAADAADHVRANFDIAGTVANYRKVYTALLSDK